MSITWNLVGIFKTPQLVHKLECKYFTVMISDKKITETQTHEYRVTVSQVFGDSPKCHPWQFLPPPSTHQAWWSLSGEVFLTTPLPSSPTTGRLAKFTPFSDLDCYIKPLNVTPQASSEPLLVFNSWSGTSSSVGAWAHDLALLSVSPISKMETTKARTSSRTVETLKRATQD